MDEGKSGFRRAEIVSRLIEVKIEGSNETLGEKAPKT